MDRLSINLRILDAVVFKSNYEPLVRKIGRGAELQGAGKSTARKWNPYGMAAGLACQVQCSWLSGLGCWQALKQTGQAYPNLHAGAG